MHFQHTHTGFHRAPLRRLNGSRALIRQNRKFYPGAILEETTGKVKAHCTAKSRETPTLLRPQTYKTQIRVKPIKTQRNPAWRIVAEVITVVCFRNMGYREKSCDRVRHVPAKYWSPLVFPLCTATQKGSSASLSCLRFLKPLKPPCYVPRCFFFCRRCVWLVWPSMCERYS